MERRGWDVKNDSRVLVTGQMVDGAVLWVREYVSERCYLLAVSS